MVAECRASHPQERMDRLSSHAHMHDMFSLADQESSVTDLLPLAVSVVRIRTGPLWGNAELNDLKPNI